MSPRDSRRPSYYGDQNMDLIKLQTMGALVPLTIFKREIEVTYRPFKSKDQWDSEDTPEYEAEAVTEKMTVHVRKRTSADMLDVGSAEGADRALLTILRCVCQSDGKPVFEDIEQVRRLEPWLSIPLMNVVAEVNRYDAKKSQPRTSSGALSLSPSAAGASRSGKTRSPKRKGRSG